MKAVILAAGLGLRLRDHHVLPKGFVTLHHQSIIVESLELLKQQGIDDILIVTGYGAEHYEQLAQKTGLFETLNNPHYTTYANLYSLYCAKDWVDDDCLFLESDLVYEARALDAVMNAAEHNIVLVSGATHATDEVYVEARHHYLTRMSKRRDALVASDIVGEFVGINKLALSAYRQLIALLDDAPDLLHEGHYEADGLVTLSKIVPLFCLTMPDLLWCEIDTAFHLERARQLYSQIRWLPSAKECMP